MKILRIVPAATLHTPSLSSLQHAGSFKARGAFNHLLSRAVPKAGVVAASGGNHGAAVAYAAAQMKVPATIFVPKVASPDQDRADPRLRRRPDDRRRALCRCAGGQRSVQQASGALSIHAYDQIETLQGQATVGLELEHRRRVWTRCWSRSAAAA